MTLTRPDFLLFLEKIDKNQPKGWVLAFEFSKLTEQITPERFKALIENMKAFENERLFRLFFVDQDVYLFFPETRLDDLKALLIKIKFMSGLNLFQGQKDIYVIYHLTTDLSLLLGHLQKNTKEETKPLATVSSLTQVFQSSNYSMPFTPALLGQLERALQHADLSNITRRQPVCAIVGKSPPMELFEEIYVALSDLRKALCPNVNIYESPWLLGRLLETLDKRVLENIIHHDAGSFKKNFSLNLAVKTILSPDFERFDETITPAFKETIFLEIKQSDIFDDIKAYLTAKRIAAAKGYRICIDMLTAESLPFIKREKLGADFIKLIWNPDLLHKAEQPAFIEHIKDNDASRIILCRVDDKIAVELGQALGISLFQGYYIQKLLYQNPKTYKGK